MAKKSGGGKLTTSSVGASQHDLFVIDDETLTDPVVKDKVFCPLLDGEVKGHGLVPRDYRVHPREMFDPPSGIEIIPKAKRLEMAREKAVSKSRVSDVMLDAGVPCLDQGQVGYCWAHSTVAAIMAVRAMMNAPTVPLSAYCVAATIKRGADEGGWCGLSAKFVRERGVCSQALWPQGDRSYRKYDTPEVWASAALHKILEEFTDVTRDIYDLNLTWEQWATCLVSNLCGPSDYNWWGHSVLGCDLVEVEPGSEGSEIRNSWGIGWGNRGFGVLRGQKAIPDSALVVRVTGASPV